MRELFKNVRTDKLFSLTMLFFLLAIFFGGSVAFAVSTAKVDESGFKTDLSGTVASGGGARDEDIVQDEVDTIIAKFKPYLTPLDTDIRREFRQVKVSGYEIKHYSSGVSMLDCKTTASYTQNTSSNAAVQLNIESDHTHIFPKQSTAIVVGVNGYEEDGVTINGDLVVFVTSNKDGIVKAEPINGPILNGKMYMPSIPSGTKMSSSANACTESQLIVSPENYSPKETTVYLQRKLSNVVITDHFKDLTKKIDYTEEDINDHALTNFRRRSNRNSWIGVQSKRKFVASETMGAQYAYTSNGILRQIKSFYGTGDTLSFSDLIGICKLQFTKNSASNTARVYCGRNFIEQLNNIDFTKHKEVSFTAKTELGMDISAFKSTFGSLDFVYDATLDDIGKEDAAYVIDIKNGVRYVMDEETMTSIDMKNGVSDAQEAERRSWKESDCVCLKGYNSIMIGKTSLVYKSAKKSSITATTVVDGNLTPNEIDGRVVYVDKVVARGFVPGTVIQYKSSLGSWVEYEGIIA